MSKVSKPNQPLRAQDMLMDEEDEGISVKNEYNSPEKSDSGSGEVPIRPRAHLWPSEHINDDAEYNDPPPFFGTAITDEELDEGRILEPALVAPSDSDKPPMTEEEIRTRNLALMDSMKSDPSFCSVCSVKFPSVRSLGAHRRWRHPELSSQRRSSGGEAGTPLRRTNPSRVGTTSRHRPDATLQTEIQLVSKLARRLMTSPSTSAQGDPKRRRKGRSSKNQGTSEQNDEAQDDRSNKNGTEAAKSPTAFGDEFNVFIPPVTESMMHSIVASACRIAVSGVKAEFATKLREMEENERRLERRVKELEGKLGMVQ